MKTAIVLASFLFVSAARAQWVVYDPTVWWQTVINTLLVSNQLEQATLLVKRLGDPESIQKVIGADGVIQGIMQPGIGQTLDQIQLMSSGANAFWYDGNGLYRVIEDFVGTPDGKIVLRAAEAYRKFEAVNQATYDFKAVHDDTEWRRLELLSQVQATTSQVEAASTDSEVQKLQAVASSQAALLAAIDRERDAALARVTVQEIENRNDEAKQQQARKEERIVDFKNASEKFTRFLAPDTSTLIIPNSKDGTLKQSRLR